MNRSCRTGLMVVTEGSRQTKRPGKETGILDEAIPGLRRGEV